MKTTHYSSSSQVGVQGLELHDEKVRVLDTLALLLGCYSDFLLELPDGRRPDVLRYDDDKKTLFMGDAKNTETPRNKQTQKRLYSYLLWLSAYVSRPNRIAVFAICFTNSIDLNGWINTIRYLAGIACVGFSELKFEQIDGETNLLWFVCSS